MVYAMHPSRRSLELSQGLFVNKAGNGRGDPGNVPSALGNGSTFFPGQKWKMLHGVGKCQALSEVPGRAFPL